MIKIFFGGKNIVLFVSARYSLVHSFTAKEVYRTLTLEAFLKLNKFLFTRIFNVEYNLKDVLKKMNILKIKKSKNIIFKY